MELLALLVALILLLALNAFYVLAEFAIVKVRPSRVAQLVAVGEKRAVLLTRIHAHLDEYLSVCQVGITLASVALGMVGERTAQVIMGESGASTWRYAVAVGISYLLISGSHILLGELVPKSIAIRIADRSAIWCARPLQFSHRLFYPVLWVLTRLANGVLRLFGIRPARNVDDHSEKELRIILDRSQERGMMSFRRLLFMENVFDFGGLKVRDAMRQRYQVRMLDTRRPWSDNLNVINTSHFTRFPLITTDAGRPSVFVHIKDLIVRGALEAPNLASLARPLLLTSETKPLETLFDEMQRQRIHMALVDDDGGRWTGFITLEDVLEELVGTIRDEFEDEEPVRLSEAIAFDRVHFNIEAESPMEAVRAALGRMAAVRLPLGIDQILHAVGGREKLLATYVGKGIGIPHARIEGLLKPFVMVLRSKEGIPFEGTAEKGHLLFVLLTPAGQPRVHQKLLAIVATLLHESEYVKERLLTATTAEEVLEVIRTGEQATLD